MDIVNLIVSHPCPYPFYPTTSNSIIAVIDHVHLYFAAKKTSYCFIAQQTFLAPQK